MLEDERTFGLQVFVKPHPFQTSRFARNLENRGIISPLFAASNKTVAVSALKSGGISGDFGAMS